MAKVNPTPVVAGVVVAAPAPGGVAVDAVAFHNLSAVTQIEFKQGNVFWEAVTGGCAPNSFMVKDRASDTPIFIMEEKSTCCNRWCLGACVCQPLYVKFYNVADGGMRSSRCCGLVPERQQYNKAGEAVMTLERPGFPDKCCMADCCICCSFCQAETFVYTGNVGDDDGGDVGKVDRSQAFSHSQVPIGGGGFTPTINVMQRTNGADTQWAVVEGPTCFGGCYDLFFPTSFHVSKQPGKAGDVATIKKKSGKDVGFCKSLCTNVDTYDIDFTDPTLTPTQKASVIAEAVNIDYLWFEREQALCRYNEANKSCEILLCLCYCFGCLCPCKCVIPLSQS